MLHHLVDGYKNGVHPEFLFFWGHTEKLPVTKACLSQWYECSFEVDGLNYRTAEQYLMAEKARIFNDQTTFDHIMKAHTPKECKQLGREVKGFNPTIWDESKWLVAVKGNYAKFSQNEPLKKFLLATGDKVIVEASPYDNIWGIGLSQDDAAAGNPLLWKGQNILGFALMAVRERLKFY